MKAVSLYEILFPPEHATSDEWTTKHKYHTTLTHECKNHTTFLFHFYQYSSKNQSIACQKSFENVSPANYTYMTITSEKEFPPPYTNFKQNKIKKYE